LSAPSQVTERIGLVATGSTTFDAPNHIAQRFASLARRGAPPSPPNEALTTDTVAHINYLT
jgi:hypothetical protein